MDPTPLPGQAFPPEVMDARFIQDTLRFIDIDTDDRPRPVPELPDPTALAGPIAQALVEVLAGRRPVVQLVRWTSPAVYAALSARSTVAQRRRHATTSTPVRVSVRRVVVTRPHDDVAELAIVVIDGIRVRAIAARLRASLGRWVIDALQVG